ncbi:MAG: dockerin type I domain-containing protein [Candidatus Zixiibacteriota bacterium]
MNFRYRGMLLSLCFLLGIGMAGLMVGSPCQAQTCAWDAGDPYKMHFPQYPDEAGWDVNATFPIMLAEDWQCTESGPVKDFHFWGSWKDGTVGTIIGFQLRVYSDIPVDPPNILYSRPGTLLWEYVAEDFTMVPIDPPTMEGWYDPTTGETLWNNHQQYFQYNICLQENQWFEQVEGTIYWLCISAILADAQATQWGWKSTLDHFNDDAVVGIDGALDWEEIWEPAEPLVNDFTIAIDPAGGFLGGGGTGAFGTGWYFYPEDDWWNIWFYDHPFDPERRKVGFIEYDIILLDPTNPGYIEIAVNWSTDLWSIEQPPGDSTPPMPGVPELPYIGRTILYAGEVVNGHYRFPYEILDYNPEWVSVDVRGYNFEIPLGIIEHTCQGSMDLAFVVTNEGFQFEEEACCYPDGSCGNVDPTTCTASGGTPQGPGTVCTAPEACCLPDGSCLMTDPICCDDLGGVRMGAGSSCTAPEACCMPDGSCLMADPLCCTGMGGTPQGQGTVCSQFEACCMPDGSCRDLDPLCCVDLGGTPQGVGSACTGITIACCMPDGSCMTVEPQCCDDLGGTVSPYGYTSCLGDNDGNLIDDACEPPNDNGACCLPDGSCIVTTAADCAQQGGVFKGVGTNCFGDSNGNGIDDACEDPWQPGDGHKMHYPQLPDELGWNVWDTYPSVLADDWMCSETGPVKDFHFWGSWMHGITGIVNSFTIRIYTDVPVMPPDEMYSHPGELLWEREIYNFNATHILPDLPEGWFDPATGAAIPDDHFDYWQYDIYLPEADWFYQVEGTIYWLSITAHVQEPMETFWGWKSSIEHWNDDAVWKEWMIYCVGPDNGQGTVDLPVPHCPYVSNGGVLVLTDGLPPGTTIEMEPMIDGYTNIVRASGGSLGGEMETFDANLQLTVAGTGSLAGYSRLLNVPLTMEFHQGPRVYGDPIQLFPSLVWALDGQLFGDPDFCTFHIYAGNAFGLPSPGETKLERLPDGTYHIDSFFDVTFQVDWQGCPGSPLDGMVGSSVTTVRIELDGPQLGDWFELYEPPDYEQSMDLSFVITNGIVEDTCDGQDPGDVNSDGGKDINDVTYLINYILLGGPPPPVQANGDVNGDCCIDMWDVVDLRDFLFSGGAPPVTCTCVNPPVCSCFPGDANGDASVNIGDAVYMINFIFKGGPGPTPYATCSGDANCDCNVNIGDAVYIINYIFKGGPRPCSCCAWVALCGSLHK